MGRRNWTVWMAAALAPWMAGAAPLAQGPHCPDQGVILEGESVVEGIQVCTWSIGIKGLGMVSFTTVCPVLVTVIPPHNVCGPTGDMPGYRCVPLGHATTGVFEVVCAAGPLSSLGLTPGCRRGKRMVSARVQTFQAVACRDSRP